MKPGKVQLFFLCSREIIALALTHRKTFCYFRGGLS